MPEDDYEASASVVFMCGDASNGNVVLCNNSLFEKIIHEVASNGDDLIALCQDGCYNLNTGALVLNCDFKASSFCTGKKTQYLLSSSDPVVYSWGEGPYGELGLGFCKTRVEKPVPIKHKSPFTSISCGEYHCAALDNIGNAYSWGQNFDRQLGLYRNDSSNFKGPNCVVQEVMFTPSLLPFSLLCPIKKISCGARFTIAIGRNGDLWSWGAGECGQLGTGRCTKREAPSKVLISVPTPTDQEIVTENDGTNKEDIVRMVDVACGDCHVIAVGSDGSVYGWGLNNRGQLGVGDTETRHVPCVLPSIFMSKVYANGLSSAGISTAGDLFTWGSGSRYRLMQQKEEEGVRQGDNSHKITPTYVETLYGNIVHSFSFSRAASAALVVTRLYELSPTSGPQKSFKELQIQGCGFWDSDRIIVTFSCVVKEVLDPYTANPNPKPRSAPGRLSAPGVISCKPPRLAEASEYEVTVSLDGVVFIQDCLLLTIYPDVTVCALTPKLLDRRCPGPTHITLTLKGFMPPAKDQFADLDPLFYTVKLLFGPLLSSGGSGKGGDVPVTEVIVQGLLEVKEAGRVTGGSNEIIVPSQPTPPSVCTLSCDISEALQGVKIPNLFSIRALVTMNGVDFSAASNDSTCMIISHAFQPRNLSPSSCQCPLPDPMTPPQGMKEIRVIGDSFFPSRDLPPNLLVQALLTATMPTGQSAVKVDDTQLSERESRNESKNGDNDEVETVSIVVPVRCVSQREMFFVPPTLNQITALFKPCYPPRDFNIIKTSVHFQLVTKAEIVSQKNATRAFGATSETLGTMKGGPGVKVGVDSVQSLSPSVSASGKANRVLFLQLFNPQPITISPFVCRRPGGTVLTIKGTHPGGLKCCPFPSLVKVQLAAMGGEGQVLLSVPEVVVLTEGVVRRNEVTQPLAVDAVAERLGTLSIEDEGEKEGQSSLLSKLFPVDGAAAASSFDDMLPSSSSDEADYSDVEYKVQFTMPDVSTLLAKDPGSTKSFDTVTVSLLLDGATAAPSSYSFNVLLFDGLKVGTVLNPKGGHSSGCQVTVAVQGIPDIVTDCIVQIRGEDKDRHASGIFPPKNYVEVPGVRSRDSPQEVTFTLPDADTISKIVPCLVKKAKMYYIDISIDGGSSLDSSSSPLLHMM